MNYTFMMMNCPMHPLTMDETVHEIKRRIDANIFTQHVVVNVAKIVAMQSDSSLRDSVVESDIVNIDGMGIVWGARFLGHPVSERVAGIDLFCRLAVLAELNGYPVYYLGARSDVVESVAKEMRRRHPRLKIAGFHHGYFWENEEAIVDEIRRSGAKLLFVAITSPQKETFVNRWRDQLGVTFVMGVGGTFDVIAGRVKRAPRWMQAGGLEWLYRLLQEPQRMWKRYLITNMMFAIMLIKEKYNRILCCNPIRID